jgi:mannosyltransferase
MSWKRIEIVSNKVESFVGSLPTQVVLLGILMVSLLLRLPRLEGRPIWYDEAFSIFLSQQPLARIISGTAPDTMPPLYYFLLHGWMSINQQVWFMRALNVIISIGIVALVYGLSTKLFGNSAGKWAALFAAISPQQIFFAQELRMYALLTLALLGYTYFFLQLWHEQLSPRHYWMSWIGLIVCGSAAMYSHNLAIFSIIASNIFLVFRREWRCLTRLFLAQLAIGLITLPWLVIVPEQIQKIQTAFWTPQPGLVQVLQAIVTFHTNLPVPERLLPIAIITSVQMIALVFYETRKISRGDHAVLAMVNITLIPPLLLFVISYFMRPVFVPRAFMLSSLTYYALAGRVVSDVRNRTIGLVIAFLFIIPALISLPAQYTYESFPRSPYKKAADKLDDLISEEDVIVHDNKLSYFPMHYYQPKLHQLFITDIPGSHNDTLAPGSQYAMSIFPSPNIETAVGNAEHVWFVVYERAIAEYVETGQPNHPQLTWFYERFDLANILTFNDLFIYEFVQ